MVSDPDNKILLFEIRAEARRQVTFAAYQYEMKKFLWQDVAFEESWWISLLAVSDSIVLLQKYDNAENPDIRSVWAFNLETQQIQWKREKFSLHQLRDHLVSGYNLSEKDSALVELDLKSGEVIEKPGDTELFDEPGKIPDLYKPFQYHEGTPYLETVRKFLNDHCNIHAVGAAEYLEYNKMIIISYNIQQENGLANFLLVIDEKAEILMNEKLGEQLKGIGVDTFFVLSGCLFFVRNKTELLSYQII